MRMFLHEIRSNYKALIIWCIAILGLLAMGTYEYSSLSTSQTGSMEELTATIPEALQVLFGMNGLDLSTASGYYSVLYFYFLLMGAIYAGMLGVKVITKEEQDKTAEFLFVKPVSRSWILTCKIKAGLACLLVFNLTLLSGTSMFFYAVESSVPTQELLILNVSFLIFQLVFFAIGMCVASVGSSSKNATAKAAVLIFACYMLNVMWQLNENLEFLKYATPFSYFPINDIIDGGGLDWTYVILSTAIILASIAYTYINFNKKDFR